MTIGEPLVSVLMTAYNRRQYIADAIESVLASSYHHFELIIVDDCSTDDTVEIARRYEKIDTRVRVFVNESNLGDYPNRNRAADLAKGKYLKYLDADDFMYPWALQVIVEMIEKFPEAGFGLGAPPDDVAPFPILITPREFYMEGLQRYHHFDRAPGSMLIKREVFNKIGGFSGRRMVGDYEFLFKIGRYYSVVKLPLDTYWNRLHSGQESKTDYAKRNYKKLREEVLAAALGHPDCPLETNDILAIRQRLARNQIKAKIIRLLAAFTRIFVHEKK